MPESRLRTVFMGSAELSCASLRALLEVPWIEIRAVVTQPDRPKGRHLKLAPSPVKLVAMETGVPVLQPERARNPDFIQQLSSLEPDLVIVVAYGQILPPSILSIPRFGCINVHTSLLPRFRGAAPIQRAILEGDPETGVTIMKMDAGLDTGPILSQAHTPILPEDTSATLHDKLAVLGADLLLKTIPAYVSGEVEPKAQPVEGVTYAAKIQKAESQVNWGQPARVIWNKVRGLTPWPGAWTSVRTDSGARRVRIVQAEVAQGSGRPGEILAAGKTGLIVACGDEALKVLVLQPEGGRPMECGQFLAGHPISPGQGFFGAAPQASIQ